MRKNIIKSKIFWIVLSLVLFLLLSSIVFAAEEQLWSLKPSYNGYYDKATCFVLAGKKCPREMSWMGNKVLYVFPIKTEKLNDKVELVFNVPFKNYGTNEDVILEIRAGKNLLFTKKIVSDLKIDHLGEYRVSIDSSLFREGWPNFIILRGKNINPIGYGTNPPNFQISSIKLVN